jgi:hypothetical protein
VANPFDDGFDDEAGSGFHEAVEESFFDGGEVLVAGGEGGLAIGG